MASQVSHRVSLFAVHGSKLKARLKSVVDLVHRSFVARVRTTSEALILNALANRHAIL
jgi:hypothetical protein